MFSVCDEADRGRTVQCHPPAANPWPPTPAAAESAKVTWPLEWAGCGQLLQTPLRLLSPLTRSPRGERSPVSILDQPWTETCCHMCCIQMLWSKLGSELNHPRFSINRGPSCQLSLWGIVNYNSMSSLGYLPFWFFSMQGKRKESRNGKWCTHPILVTLSWRKYFFWSIFEGRRCFMVTSLQTDWNNINWELEKSLGPHSTVFLSFEPKCNVTHVGHVGEMLFWIWKKKKKSKK